MTQAIEVDRLMAVSPDRAASVFWDIAGWYRVWDRISEVEVRYDDGVHQEFAMAVERDGRIEQVRTLRFRTGSGDIEFVSPEAPPAMSFHRGAWRFAPEAGGCRITAARTYDLSPRPAEDREAYARRSEEYRERFEQRLGRILDCFADHFASEFASEAGDKMIACTAGIGIDRPPAEVGGYLSEVANLPAWTTFFRSVGPSPDGRRYPVETVMGPVETWIEASAAPGGVLVRAITSMIGDQREQAVLRLAPGGAGTAVEFTVRLPAGTSEERVAGQRAAMAGELRRLKHLLERAG